MSQPKQKSYKAGVIQAKTPMYTENKDYTKNQDKNGDVRLSRQEQFRLDQMAWTSLEDRIARSAVFIRRHLVKKFKDHFSKKTETRNRQNLYYVDKYYQFSYVEDSMGNRVRKELFIDLPKDDYALKDCIIKQEICKSLGIRYAYILDGDTIDVVLDRLGEFK